MEAEIAFFVATSFIQRPFKKKRMNEKLLSHPNFCRNMSYKTKLEVIKL